MATQSALAILGDRVDQRRPANKYDAPDVIAETSPALPVVAIAITLDEDRRRLTDLLGGLNVDVSSHENLWTLRRTLLREEADLVITDVTLPDGNWACVLRLTVETSPRPGVVVHSRVVNDRLSSEVLRRGAYDMLISPYSPKDGRRVVEGALQASYVLDEPQLVGLKH